LIEIGDVDYDTPCNLFIGVCVGSVMKVPLAFAHSNRGRRVLLEENVHSFDNAGLMERVGCVATTGI